ncbi:MAG: CPBP family intramembrane metalloprotease [Chloroflexi bacterium]|nr:CPBP family intramembrane metalloprotease [Chloroflexota bacterium]
MLDKKRFAPVLPYFAVWAGLFLFRSAWTALLGFHAAILIILALMRPRLPSAVLFKSERFRWVAASVLFSLAGGIGLRLFWNMFGIASDLPAQLDALGLNESSWAGFIAYFSLVNPFVEEYFWRGVLDDGARGLRPVDFLYAGYHALILWGKVHFLSIVFALAVLVLAGWFWRQISRLDKGLLAAVLGHMAADFSILTVARWMCV